MRTIHHMPTRTDHGMGTETRTITGHLDTGAPDFVYVPIEVPPGVREIAVSYSYDKPSTPAGDGGNVCDIGIFDERGVELGGRGFRGWSGGARSEFAISAERATPGYLPGPIRPGTWHIVLGPYQLAAQGMDFELDVTFGYGAAGSPFVPHYPPQSVPGRGVGWYRGDCHLHTVHSDGMRTPDQVAAGARAAGLDFIVSTDHNTSSSHAAWGPAAGDDLLVVTGEEVTTRDGHYLALGLPPGDWIDWRYRAADQRFAEFSRRIRDSGGIVVPAHPHCPNLACRWKFGYDDVDAIEVWNGLWTADDEATLATWDAMLVTSARTGGGWLPAIGNSDAHREPQVIGLPQTVVRAAGLSRDALMAGIRAGRSWLAGSKDVSLDFEASGGGLTAGVGQRVAIADDASVTVRAAVSGVPNGVVRLVTDGGQVQQISLSPSGDGTVTWIGTPSLARYVRCEVRHPSADEPDPPLGPMAAMSNPIWLGEGRS